MQRVERRLSAALHDAEACALDRDARDRLTAYASAERRRELGRTADPVHEVCWDCGVQRDKVCHVGSYKVIGDR
jgi:hypothetical protein